MDPSRLSGSVFFFGFCFVVPEKVGVEGGFTTITLVTLINEHHENEDPGGASTNSLRATTGSKQAGSSTILMADYY